MSTTFNENDYHYYRTKEDGYLLVILYHQPTQTSHIFLLDPWKSGIRGIEVYQGNLQKIKRRLNLQDVTFHKIPLSQVKKLLAQNLAIAESLEINLPQSIVTWIDILNIRDQKLSGSLYKCFNCEEGDLEQTDVDEILEIAKSDLTASRIGTDQEEQYFYICSKCKGKIHNAHN